MIEKEVLHPVKRTADLAGLLGLHKSSDISKTRIIVDLKDFTFFEPLHVTLLAQHVIILANQGCPEIIFSNTPKYLLEIGLIEFCRSNQLIPSTVDQIRSSTAMPLMRVSTETMYNYIKKAVDYVRAFCPGKDLSMLVTGVSELINNVYDHSKSPVGAYVFGQYFPNKRQIKLAVSDAGIGIPQSVNTHKKKRGEDVISNKDCLKWAFANKNTIQSTPANKGLGLNTITTFLSANKGVLRLLTDSVGQKIENNEILYYEYSPLVFSGTVIEITINVDNLQDLDEEDFMFE